MCLLFLVSGFGKVSVGAATQDFMAAHGVPGFLLWPAAALELSGGLLPLFGLWTRPICLVLAGWCLLTALTFHTAFSDRNKMVNFLKNRTMAGGLLALARSGAEGLGLDALLSIRKQHA